MGPQRPRESPDLTGLMKVGAAVLEDVPGPSLEARLEAAEPGAEQTVTELGHALRQVR